MGYFLNYPSSTGSAAFADWDTYDQAGDGSEKTLTGPSSAWAGAVYNFFPKSLAALVFDASTPSVIGLSADENVITKKHDLGGTVGSSGSYLGRATWISDCLIMVGGSGNEISALYPVGDDIMQNYVTSTAFTTVAFRPCEMTAAGDGVAALYAHSVNPKLRVHRIKVTGTAGTPDIATDASLSLETTVAAANACLGYRTINKFLAVYQRNATNVVATLLSFASGTPAFSTQGTTAQQIIASAYTPIALIEISQTEFVLLYDTGSALYVLPLLIDEGANTVTAGTGVQVVATSFTEPWGNLSWCPIGGGYFAVVYNDGASSNVLKIYKYSNNAITLKNTQTLTSSAGDTGLGIALLRDNRLFYAYEKPSGTYKARVLNP